MLYGSRARRYNAFMDKNTLSRALEAVRMWLQFRYQQEDLPGLAVAITHKSKVVLDECFGYADVQKEIRLTPGHLFRVASHSKTFTATAVLQLQEEGALELDTPVAAYLPWLRGHADKRWQNVTVRQLLCHGAGVIRDGLDADFWQLERPFPDAAAFKKAVLAADLVMDNDVRLKYSNFGYGVLGLVIEAVSGQDYHAYAAEHLIRPLKLEHAYPEYSVALAKQLVTGYAGRVNKAERLPIANIGTGALAPATGFCAAPSDLSRFFAALRPGTGQLLTDASKKEMQREHFPIRDNAGHIKGHYGLGLKLATLNERTLYGHGGSFPGHRTQTLFDPTTGLCVTVAVNAINGPAENLLKAIFSIIDFIRNHPAPARPLRRLEGMYACLWDVAWVLVSGKDMFVAYPGSDPVTQTDKLERLDDTTFKVVQTSSIESGGELVRFIIKNGTVTRLSYAGMTMWPLAVWQKKHQKQSVIELP